MRGYLPRGPISRYVPLISIAVACAVFAVVRLFTLRRDFHPHKIEITDFGILAAHLPDGLIAPPSAYMPLVREGGSLAFGLFCASAFAVMGPSLLTLREANVLWHVLVLAVFAALAWRLARGWGVALMACLWTLAPPALIKLQQFGWANHLETTLLGGLAVALFAASLTTRRWRPSAAYAFGAGMTAGLAPFFTYVGLSMMASLVLAAVLCRVWRTRRTALLFLAAGLFVGLVPLAMARLMWFDPAGIWYSSGGSAADFLLGASPLPAAGANATLPASGFQLLFVCLPRVWGFPGPAGPSAASGWLYLLPVYALIALGIAFRPRPGEGAGVAERSQHRGRTAVMVAAGSMIVVHLGACLALGLNAAMLPDRYVLPIAPYLMLLACSAAAVPWRKGPWLHNWPRLLAVGLALVPLGLSEVHMVSAARQPDRSQQQRSFKGYRFVSGMIGCLRQRPADDLYRLAEQRPDDRFELLRLMGETTAFRLQSESLSKGADWGAVVAAEFADLPEAAHPWLWEGAGRAVLPASSSPGRGLDGGRSMDLLRADLPPSSRMYFGLGYNLDTTDRPGFSKVWTEVRGFVPPQGMRAVCAGVAAGQAHHRYVLLDHGLPGQSWIDGCEVDWLATGIGMQVARETLADTHWAEDEPYLAWFVPWLDHPTAQDAFMTAYHAERDLLAILATEGWLDASVVDTLGADEGRTTE